MKWDVVCRALGVAMVSATFCFMYTQVTASLIIPPTGQVNQDLGKALTLSELFEKNT